MASVRDQLDAALVEALTHNERYLRHARRIDRPERVTIMLRLDKIQPAPDAEQASRRAEFTLMLVGTKVEQASQDDELESVLDRTLYDLDRHDSIVWTEAVRTTWEDTKFPAWGISCWTIYTADLPTEQE